MMMSEWGVSVGFVAPGGPEFILVLLVLLLLFGAKDAPRILRKISDVITQFRHTANTFKHDIMYSDMRAEADARGAEVEEDLGSFDEPEEGFEVDPDGCVEADEAHPKVDGISEDEVASDSDMSIDEGDEQPKVDGESDVESD